MRLRVVLVLLSAAVAGCSASLSTQIQKSVDLAETCRHLEQQKSYGLKLDRSQFSDLIRTRLLADTSCIGSNGVLGPHPMLECALADIAQRFSSDAKLMSDVETLNVRLNAIVDANKTLRKDFDALADVFSTAQCKTGPDSLEKYARCYLEFVKPVRDTPAQDSPSYWLAKVILDLGTISDHVAALRNDLALIDNAASKSRKDLAAGVASFSSAADRFLASARSALSGDLHALTADNLAASVIYQNAYRVFDMIDLGLLPIEMTLDKADQRVYGAVSVTMAFNTDKIQDAVDESLTKIVSGPETTAANWVPLGVAACERIGDPKVLRKSPILAPFVERGLASAAGKALKYIENNKAEPAASQTIPQHGVSHRPLMLLASAEGGFPAISKPEPPHVTRNDIYATDMLQTYIASEWAVRQAMTTVSTVAQGSTRDTQSLVIPSTPEEALVRRSALSLSSQRSAHQASSVMNTAYSSNLGISAAHSLAVTNALTAASAVINTTQNFNINAQRDRLPQEGVPGLVSLPTEKFQDLCVTSIKEMCIREDDGTFRFNIGPFGANKPEGDAAVRSALGIVARVARGGQQKFTVAQVIGHASRAGRSARNLALAEARAQWAARVLCDEGLKVNSTRVAGLGILQAKPRDDSSDRKVTIILTHATNSADSGCPLASTS